MKKWKKKKPAQMQRVKAGEKVTLSAYEPGEGDRIAIANNYYEV